MLKGMQISTTPERGYFEVKKMETIKNKNRCLGCGTKIEVGEICYHCLYNGIAITEIHSKYGKTRITGCDGKSYAIWIDGE